MSEESKKKRNEKISISKTGVKRPTIVSEKLSKLLKGKTFIERYGEEKGKEIGDKISKSNTGKNYHTDEWKNTLSEKMIGNDFGQYQTNETREIKRNKLIASTSEKLTPDTERNFNNINMFYEIYKTKEPSQLFSQNIRQTGINFFKLLIHPE